VWIDCRTAANEIELDFIEKSKKGNSTDSQEVDVTYKVLAQISTYSTTPTKSVNLINMVLSSHTVDVSNTDEVRIVIKTDDDSIGEVQCPSPINGGYIM